MVEIEINGKVYKGPESVEEITLDKYIEVYPYLEDSVSVSAKLKNIFALLSIYFDVPKSLIGKCKTEDVFQLYYYLLGMINLSMDNAKSKRIESFEFKGIEFKMPNEKLTDLTFGQLADALKVRQDGDAILENITGEKGNEMSYLKLILPIVLKTDDEKFNELELEEKAKFFSDLPLERAIQVDFFLQSHLNL